MMAVVFVCSIEWISTSGIATMRPNAVQFMPIEMLRDKSSAFSAGFALETAVNASINPMIVPRMPINVAMFAVELAASFIAGSVAVQADALDFLGDAGNYAVSLFVLGMAIAWRARADWPIHSFSAASARIRAVSSFSSCSSRLRF